MNILIPIHAENGLQSEISVHFGSAPAYLVVNTENGALRTISNRNRHHANGGCAPLALIHEAKVEAMIVGGIGAGALGRLSAENIVVFFAEHHTAQEALDALKAGQLSRMHAVQACAGHDHSHGGGHCHHHAHGRPELG